MKTIKCAACQERPSVTITEDGWTPLCQDCVDKVGTPVRKGKRAVCHFGSLQGTVTGFDGKGWADSGLASINTGAAQPAWIPLAELTPAI